MISETRRQRRRGASLCGLVYIYIYINQIRIWRLTAPVKAHKVQLEAMHSSKRSYFERDLEGKIRMIESAFEGKEACSEVLSKEEKNMSSSDV